MSAIDYTAEPAWVAAFINAVSAPSKQWAPRKLKEQFRPARTGIPGGDKRNFIEESLPGTDGRRIGVYLRPDFASCGKPPIVVITGGLGFGGPVAAKTWAPLLDEYNPIFVDTAGAGNSYPFGDMRGVDTNAVVDDVLGVMARLGLPSVGIAGKSFGGTIALLAADRLAAEGTPAPFVMALSPTFCRSDRGWCFGLDGMTQSLTPELQESGQARFAKLAEPVVARGIEPTPQNVLNVYTDMMCSGDADTFLDAYIRMGLWENVPYGDLDDSFNAATLEAEVSLGLRDGKTFRDFITAISNGTADMQDFMRAESDVTGMRDLITPEDQRRDIRRALFQARNLTNVKIWTAAWADNCGLEGNDVAGAVSRLAATPTARFISVNDRDPLLPSGEADLWQAADAQAQVFASTTHGPSEPAVKQAAFVWLEQQRVAMCLPDRDQRLAAVQARDSAWKELGAAVCEGNVETALLGGGYIDDTPRPTYERARIGRLVAFRQASFAARSEAATAD